MIPMSEEDKHSRLDVACELADGTKIDIEVQVVNYGNMGGLSTTGPTSI